MGFEAAKEALAVFLKESPGDSISKQRKQWEKNYTAPRALERWIGTACGSRGCRSERLPVRDLAEDRLGR